MPLPPTGGAVATSVVAVERVRPVYRLAGDADDPGDGVSRASVVVSENIEVPAMQIAVSSLAGIMCYERDVDTARGHGTLAAPSILPCLVSLPSAGHCMESTASNLTPSVRSIPDARARLISPAPHLAQPERGLPSPAVSLRSGSPTRGTSAHGSCHQSRRRRHQSRD